LVWPILNDTPLSFSRFAAVALSRLAALLVLRDHFLKISAPGKRPIQRRLQPIRSAEFVNQVQA
jgi:hypothetical protein